MTEPEIKLHEITNMIDAGHKMNAPKATHDLLSEISSSVDDLHQPLRKLTHVEQAVQEYLEALKNREIGGVAANKCLNKIQEALGMFYQG